MTTDVSGSQSVARALELLTCFTPDDPSFSLSELSEIVGLKPSTARRLLKALISKGFIEQDSSSRRYRLGMQLTRLGHIAERQSELGRIAKGPMQQLVAEFDEAAYISRLSGKDQLFLMVVHSQSWDLITAEVGETFPAWATASGRLMLAEKIDEEIDAMYADPLPRFRGEPPITVARLKQELQKIRENGYSTHITGADYNVFSRTVPIFDSSGYAAMALVISGPLDKVRPAEELLPAMRRVANEISYRIGGNSRLTRIGPIVLPEQRTARESV